MTEAAETLDQLDGETLDDLEQEWQAEQSEAAAAEDQPSPDDIEAARRLAEKMNDGFLWVVNRTQCPHVQIDQIVDRQKGVDAFEPLAERWGGEVPEWVQQFMPYIGAGVYMATTIVTARQVERQITEAAEKQQDSEGGTDGEKSELGAQ